MCRRDIFRFRFSCNSRKICTFAKNKEMKESIIIRNFGPVNEIEIDDIRPLTVFIGESGSGKSTIMKVIVLFRWIYKMVSIRSYLKHSNISQSPFKFDFKSYLAKNGLMDYLKENTEIIYLKGEDTISYIGSLDVSLIISEEHLSLDKMCFIGDKRNIIPDILANKMEKKSVSFYLKETLDDTLFALNQINQLDIDYLGVKFVAEKTPNGSIKYYIRANSEDENYSINFENSSSGTQTVVPLSLIIEYYSGKYDIVAAFNKSILGYMSQNDRLSDFKPVKNIGEIKYKNVHIHIEEPELSLYPESQRSLINFIVNRCFVKEHNDYNMTVMMATHSPYIINHINLLIMAGIKEKLEENAFLLLKNVDVFEIVDGYLNNLKQENKFIIDTRPLSVPISNIYERYNMLQNG
jgi:predicted ATPase